jgi:hypothetical protein
VLGELDAPQAAIAVAAAIMAAAARSRDVDLSMPWV